MKDQEPIFGPIKVKPGGAWVGGEWVDADEPIDQRQKERRRGDRRRRVDRRRGNDRRKK